MLRRLEWIIDKITSLAAVIGGVFTGIMTLIVGYAVTARYAFRRPIGWSEEVAVYLMVWAVFLGAAYTLKEDAHIGVDILIARLPAPMKRVFLLFHCVAGIVFTSILLYHGIDMVALTIKMDSRSIAMDFPLVLTHLAVPVGAFMLMLQYINKFLGLAAGRR